MELFSRPVPVVVALLLICIPVVQALATSYFQPVLVLIFLPSLFVLYRVWMRDNVARWFASFLVALILAVGVYGIWQKEIYLQNKIEHTTNTVARIEQRSMRPHQYAFLGCYLFGLVLLNVPSSHRWFTGR